MNNKNELVVRYRKNKYYSYFIRDEEILTKFRTYDSFMWYLIHVVKKRNEKLKLVKLC